MDEAKFERILDARIQKRLATDPAYLNAENADEQKDRENEIETEESMKITNETGYQPGLSDLLSF